MPLIAACGHEVLMVMFADHNDIHREKRIIHHQTSLCKQCKAEKHRRLLADHQRIKSKNIHNGKAKKKKFHLPKIPRLPVGSKFVCEYVDDRLWRAILTVPGRKDPYVFEGPSLFKAEEQLDRMYRRDVKREERREKKCAKRETMPQMQPAADVGGTVCPDAQGAASASGSVVMRKQQMPQEETP